MTSSPVENTKLKLKYSLGITYLELLEKQFGVKLIWLVKNEENVIWCQMTYKDEKVVKKCYEKKILNGGTCDQSQDIISL